jgi:translocation and assembly module TamB
METKRSPAPAPRSRSAWRTFASVALFVVTLLALAMGALVWTLRSEAGTAWLLGKVPGLEVSALRGALLGGSFSAARLQWMGADGTLLVIDELQWRGLSLQYVGDATPPLHVAFDRLAARRVAFTPAPGPAAPSGPRTEPVGLALPVALRIGTVSIGELQLPGLEPPLRDLSASVALGLLNGQQHRIDALHVQWDRVQVDGAAAIAAQPPFDVQAEVHARPAPDSAPPMPWTALLEATGPLARLQVSLNLGVTVPAGRNAPSLDAQATIAPFAQWPVAALEASTRTLDLSLFSGALPLTALSGRAVIHTDGLGKPVQVDLALDNPAAGTWNEGRLPVRRLTTRAQGQLDAATGIELHSLVAELGDARHAAGRIEGSGHWARSGYSAQLRLDHVLTEVLDARAAALDVTGSLQCEGRGLPGETEFGATLSGDLQGRARVGPPVQLRWHASAAGQHLQIDELRADAGDAHATLKAHADRQPSGGWRGAAQSRWTAFDPRPWWRGREDSPWRTAVHRLNGQLDADVAIADAGRITLAALRGSASLKLDESLLAGVPLSGELSLRAPGGALEGHLSLDASGNQVDASLHWNTAGDGRSDHLQVDAKAPALDKLAPALRLLPGAPATVAGALQMSAQLEGRWPRVASQGHLDAQDLAVADLRVATAQARWTVATQADSPIDLQVSLAQLSRGPQRIEHASLRVQGTPAAHDIAFDAATPAQPPSWAQGLMNEPKENAEPTRATLRAKGGLTGPASAPQGWRGRIEEIMVASGDDKLLAAHAVDVAWQGGAEPSVSVSPSRIELLHGALRVARAQWVGGTRPIIDLQAELEPLVIAPLLARLQPDLGWSGDLTVAGHASLRNASGFTADVVLERTHGDLQLHDPTAGVPQPLGLSDLRIALDAHEGTWHLTEAMAGSAVGVVSGVQSLRMPRDALWPPPHTPLDGVLELRVEELAAWGGWVPAGWHLAGSLHTSATFGGRFDALELTGHVEGHGIGVRNVLEGVDVRDGEVSIALQGERARIERFTAREGDGEVTLSGELLLGERPKAVLALKADHLRLLGRVDRRIVMSGEGQLELDPSRIALSGRFMVDEGLIDFSQSDAPSLGDDVHVYRGAQSPQGSSAQRARPARNVSLDLRLDLGEQLRIRGHGLDTGLRGDLHMSAPGGRMSVNGSIRTQSGTYAAYGQKLDIERGVLVFNGPVENPRLDILAIRPNLDVRVGVAVTGPAQNPRVRLYSEPDMTDVDKLSWLMLGRPTDGLGGTDVALLQRAALALIQGEKAQGGTTILGLDTLSVRQTTDGDVHDTVVTMGKQLSQRWYVGYERGLNATTGTWQLIYRIAQRFTVRAQSGDDNSLDMIWTWRWN